MTGSRHTVKSLQRKLPWLKKDPAKLTRNVPASPLPASRTRISPEEPERVEDTRRLCVRSHAFTDTSLAEGPSSGSTGAASGWATGGGGSAAMNPSVLAEAPSLALADASALTAGAGAGDSSGTGGGGGGSGSVCAMAFELRPPINAARIVLVGRA